MKLHHYAMVFLVLTFGVLATYVVRNHVLNKTYTESIKCENELTSSLLDSITDAVETSNDGTYVFISEDRRKKAYDEFYKTLALNLNEYLTKDTYIQDTIPCLFLVDTDGYYVVFRENDATNTLTTIISPLNTWADYVDNGHWIIRYYLTDYVSVIDRDTGAHYDGRLSEVKDKLTDDGLLYVFDTYVHDYETYASNREYVIWRVMEESLNYYVNKYNVNTQYCYDLSIPMTTGIWQGHPIDKPCMFALMQGEYFGLSGTNSNVFAYANGEEINERIYYCSGDYYHKSTCPYIGQIEFKGDIKGCAKHGYDPCPNCD